MFIGGNLMRRIVLIDGENLLYALRTMVGTKEEKAPRSTFVDFPFKALINEVLADGRPAMMLLYGTRLHKYDQTPELLKKTERTIKAQADLVNTLHGQGITFIKVGTLRARETEPCGECGSKEWYLLEKGVDVGLAVRMVSEANEETEIVLVSSDTDLLPAVKTARQKGSKIIFIGYEHRPILSLINLADVTRVITLPLVEKHLKSIKSTGS